MRGVTWVVWAALVGLGCGGNPCDEDEVRRDGECALYDADDPVRGDVWEPGTGTTWQWQLTGTFDPSPNVQMFDVDVDELGASLIADLHDQNRVVICYFSAGTWEDWRSDAGGIPEDAIGEALPEWQDEAWLDTTHSGVRDFMSGRLDDLADMGCDGVEPDNMDAYANDNGFDLSELEQLDYNRFIADEAHRRDLSVGLKNDLDQLEDLVDWYDWALNEECGDYDECDRLDVFTTVGKAAFRVEYVDDWADAESKAAARCGDAEDADTLIKTWDVGPEFLACD